MVEQEESNNLICEFEWTDYQKEQFVFVLKDPVNFETVYSIRSVNLEGFVLHDSSGAIVRDPLVRHRYIRLVHLYLEEDIRFMRIAKALKGKQLPILFAKDLENVVEEGFDDYVVWYRSLPKKFRLRTTVSSALHEAAEVLHDLKKERLSKQEM
jgi:hypothetical protein